MQTKLKGILTLVGGFLIHCILGTVYLWGGVSGYIRSYYCWNGYSPDGDVNNCSITDRSVGIVFPIMFQAQGICYSFGVYLSNKVGLKLHMILCSIAMPLSIFCSSFVDNFWWFSVLYGFNFGMIAGFIYMVPFNLAYQYYPMQRGLAAGIINSGFGVGTIVFSTIAFNIVNPDNVQPDENNQIFPENVANNWPKAVRILSSIYCGVLLLGTFLLQKPTKEDIEEVDRVVRIKKLLLSQSSNSNDYLAEDQGYFQQSQREHSTVNKHKEHFRECPNVKTGLKQWRLYFLIFQIWTMACVGTMFSSQYKVYGELFPALDSDKFLTMTGNVGALFNSISRVFWGGVQDHLRFKFVISIMGLIQVIIMSSVSSIIDYQWLYTVYVILAYFSYGGLYSVFATQSAVFYGRRVGLKITSIIFQGFNLACWTQYLVTNVFISSDDEKHDFNVVFHSYALIPFVGIILVNIMNYQVDWDSDKFDDEFENSVDVEEYTDNENEDGEYTEIKNKGI